MSTHLTNTTAGSTDPAITGPAPTSPSPSGPAPKWSIPAVLGLDAGTDGMSGRSVEEQFPWQALHTLPTRQLRIMCNRIFKVMDTDFPPADTVDQYAVLVEEISLREIQARNRGEGRGEVRGQRQGEGRGKDQNEPNLAFRDSPGARRFELYVDGTLAGYVKYLMHGGQVILLETVLTADFSSPDSGIEETLIRRTFLNAHRRRLAVRVHCGRVRSFLAEYPQYRSLVPATAQHASTRITRPVL